MVYFFLFMLCQSQAFNIQHDWADGVVSCHCLALGLCDVVSV